MENHNLHKLHIELWDWKAKNPFIATRHWPKWDPDSYHSYDGTEIPNACFPCAAAYIKIKAGHGGDPCVPHVCPIAISAGVCGEHGSLWQKYSLCFTEDERRALSEQLRDTEWTGEKLFDLKLL